MLDQMEKFKHMLQCYECNEYGHFKSYCPKLKEDNKKRK